jgi:hypothetical protein
MRDIDNLVSHDNQMMAGYHGKNYTLCHLHSDRQARKSHQPVGTSHSAEAEPQTWTDKNDEVEDAA